MTPHEMEKALEKINIRLDGHSAFLLDVVEPKLAEVSRKMDGLWITDSRFRDLSQAVADIAAEVYRWRTGKRINDR